MKYPFQIFAAESRLELLTTIMMINTVRKPDTLEIDLQSLEVVRLTINRKVRINDFEHLADAEIVFPVLIEGDIPAKKCRFGKIIDKYLLPKRQFLKSIQSIAKQLQISKPLALIVEIHEASSLNPFCAYWPS